MPFLNFVWTYAGLLCGSKLTDCQNATDPSCYGGIAMVSALVRHTTDETVVGSMVMPRFDFESAFPQMHPLDWTVNRLVHKERFGFDTYFAYSSLLSQGREDGDISNRDLSDLQSQEFRPLISSVAVPTYNTWSQYVKSVHFDEKSGLAVLPLSHAVDVKFGIPRLRAAQGLLDYVYRVNRLNGCDGEKTEYQKYLQDNWKRNATVTTADKRCWIPVAVSEVSIPGNEFYQQLSEYKNPPALIVDVRGNYLDAFENPIQIGPTGVWIVGYTNTNWVHNQLRIEVTDDRRSIVNVTYMQQDLGKIPDEVRDEQYGEDVAFLRTLADEAIGNDPLVGKTGFMPTARDWDRSLIPCMAGECPIGNLFADAMRWEAQADFSFLNSGGVRSPGWSEGDVHMSNIWEALPFANTLCTGQMTGLSMFRLFNFSTSIATFSATWDPVGDRLTQVAGVRLTYNTDLEESRLVDLKIWDEDEGDYVPVERLKMYKFATDSWMCTGFWDFIPFVNETLVVEGEERGTVGSTLVQNALSDYLGQLNQPYDTSIQGRLVNDTEKTTALNWIQSQDTCSSRTYWDERYLTCFQCPSTEKVLFEEELLEFAGVSGIDDPSFGSIEVVNGEDFPVFMTIESKPEWLSFTIPTSEDEEIVLQSGEKLTLEFLVSAASLEPGTASTSVSFKVVDGGSYPGCIGVDAKFNIEVSVSPEPELNRPGSIRIAGFTLMGVVLFTAMSFGLWVHMNRHRAAVKAMQPFFLISLCAGVGVIALAIVPLSIEDYIVSTPGRNPACMATPWLLSMGFTAVVSTLNAKLWRINKLFENTLRRRTVELREALVISVCTFGINLAILLIWTLVDPLEWDIKSKQDEEWRLYGTCNSSGTAGIAFFSILCAFDFFVFLLACYQAIKARQIPETMSESKQLGIGLLSWFQILLVGVPILFLIEDDNSNAHYFVVVTVIFASCMSMLLFIFPPIIYNAMSLPETSGKKRGSNVRITGLDPSAALASNSMAFHAQASGVMRPPVPPQEKAPSSTDGVRGSEALSNKTSDVEESTSEVKAKNSSNEELDEKQNTSIEEGVEEE